MRTRSEILKDEFHAARNDSSERIQAHAYAMMAPKAGYEQSICDLLNGWIRYAEAHHKRFGAVIAEDLWFRDIWIQMGQALRSLLIGETGRLNGGRMDALICNFAKEHGVDLHEGV